MKRVFKPLFATLSTALLCLAACDNNDAPDPAPAAPTHKMCEVSVGTGDSGWGNATTRTETNSLEPGTKILAVVADMTDNANKVYKIENLTVGEGGAIKFMLPMDLAIKVYFLSYNSKEDMPKVEGLKAGTSLGNFDWTVNSPIDIMRAMSKPLTISSTSGETPQLEPENGGGMLMFEHIFASRITININSSGVGDIEEITNPTIVAGHADSGRFTGMEGGFSAHDPGENEFPLNVGSISEPSPSFTFGNAQLFIPNNDIGQPMIKFGSLTIGGRTAENLSVTLSKKFNPGVNYTVYLTVGQKNHGEFVITDNGLLSGGNYEGGPIEFPL